MKKSAIIIMTLALLLGVSACNKEQSDTYDKTDTIAVHEDVTAQSNADDEVTENAEQMTDSNGNSVSSTDKQSAKEQNGSSVDNNTTTSSQIKTDKADTTTEKKSDSSQKDEKTTQISNPFGSGIELPEMEV